MSSATARVFHNTFKVITAATLLLHSIFGCGLVHACANTDFCVSASCCNESSDSDARELSADQGTNARTEHGEGNRSHKCCRLHENSDAVSFLTKDRWMATESDVNIDGSATHHAASQHRCGHENSDCCCELACRFLLTNTTQPTRLSNTLVNFASLSAEERSLACDKGRGAWLEMEARHQCSSNSRCVWHCSWQL